MYRKNIPVNRPLLNGNEKKYLEECITTGWISSEGPFVKRFEENITNLTGRRYAIAVCNGTAAIEVAVNALQIGNGDEVIMPTFTIISCAAPIVRAGGMPVLVDSDSETWNMDVGKIEEKITRRTKAIMVVHTYGLPVDMDPVLDIAHRYGLKVIEDSAEAIGQTYKGKPCGSFGDISVLSFYPNKHITTGEGGMILTDDPLLAERSRRLRDLCFQPERRFIHEELGWNFRMTNMQAAIGCAQYENIDLTIRRKREIGAKYRELLRETKHIQLPLEKTSYASNIYWVFGVVLKEDVLFDAKEAMRRLSLQGIGTRPFFWPMHKQPVFNKMGLFNEEKHPVSETLATRGFYIPSGTGIEDTEIVESAEKLKGILNENH